MQFIEGVEKALHGLFLAADKLDIINQQHVNISVFIAELVSFPLPDGTNELIGKLLGADTNHFNMARQSCMPDGVQEMGLAQSHPSVNKQRIVGGSRFLGHSQGSGISQLVAVADDK